jgi:hypothetical protein
MGEEPGLVGAVHVSVAVLPVSVAEGVPAEDGADGRVPMMVAVIAAEVSEPGYESVIRSAGANQVVVQKEFCPADPPLPPGTWAKAAVTGAPFAGSE